MESVVQRVMGGILAPRFDWGVTAACARDHKGLPGVSGCSVPRQCRRHPAVTVAVLRFVVY